MSVYTWVVTNMKGEIEGAHSGIFASSIDIFDGIQLPTGFMKTRLTQDEYEQLMFSFDASKKVYTKAVDPIPINSAVRELTEEEKASLELTTKPKRYRYKLSKDGRQRLHEWYNDYEGTVLRFTQLDVKDESGEFIKGEQIAV